jgi:tRNA modification GTPase
VLRLSGPDAGAVLAGLAGGLPPPRRASLRTLRDAAGEPLDRALILWFPGPGSYTGEDSAELHLHGGPAVRRAVADALVAAGCRPAEPGEFTRRAVLQGRLDLTAAEGVADLVAAETQAQRRQALRQAEGGLARRLAGWAERLLRILADQEAAIEFAEEGLPGDLAERAAASMRALAMELREAVREGERPERLREGLHFAILGAPNAGKSSLLNALAGREAAIVSARAGTTRDVVEVRLELAGVPVTLADTAGLRETTDEIEAEGVRRALGRGREADFVLAVFAADQPPDVATGELLGAGALAVLSKTDLAAGPPLDGAIRVSALTGAGLGVLRARLEAEAARLAGIGEAAALTRPRHRAALGEAAAWLEEGAEARLPELAAEASRVALRALGRLTGRFGAEEVLDVVFREFCIGK